ncbi:hypothetical protein [Paenirhodobacter sp.]|uniref:hypothetical protein n=1 Tax=Paenirhodobacter sp. TaxID=1965326 RepID=UPI003B3F1420
MNIPVTPPLDVPEHPASLRAKPLDDATLVGLAPHVCAAYFDRSAPSGARQRLVAKQDGSPIPKPFITGTFDLRGGGVRHVLLMARGIDEVFARPLALYLNDTLAAELDPGWLQLPIADLAALVEGLTEAGRAKLLRMLLTTGASLFLAAAGPALIASFRTMMEICDLAPVEPVSATGFGGQTVLSYRAPGHQGLAAQVDVVVLARERPALLRKVALVQDGQNLHIHLPPAAQDCEVVLFGDHPLRLAPPPAQMRRLPAPVWLEGRTTAVRDWLVEQVLAAARKDPGAANALRELRPDAVEPQLTVRHLSATRSGMLYAVDLSDPQGLVRAILLERDGRRVELSACCGVDGAGLIAGVGEVAGRADGTEPYRILLLHHSGRLREVARGVLQTFDGTLAAEFSDFWKETADMRTLEKALAGACLGAIREPLRHVSRRFGTPPNASVLRVVTDLGDSIDLLRARAAMIFAERGAQRVEVVCTLSEGPLASASRRAVEEVVAVYGIPHSVITLSATASPAERILAGLSEGAGPALVLAEGALPTGPGWLSAWQRRLASAKEDVIGSVLLAADGSVAAAENRPEDGWRGLPVSRLPETLRGIRRPIPDCFALTEAGIQRLLARAAAHPDPAVLIAQLIPETGLQIATKHGFMRYTPAPACDPFALALQQAALVLTEETAA